MHSVGRIMLTHLEHVQGCQPVMPKSKTVLSPTRARTNYFAERNDTDWFPNANLIDGADIEQAPNIHSVVKRMLEVAKTNGFPNPRKKFGHFRTSFSAGRPADIFRLKLN